jgi:hypothetical protein
MKETLNIDERLLDEAKSGCGAMTETVGLEALIRHAAYSSLGASRIRAACPRDVPAASGRPVDQALDHVIVLVATSVWIRFPSNRGRYVSERGRSWTAMK